MVGSGSGGWEVLRTRRVQCWDSATRPLPAWLQRVLAAVHASVFLPAAADAPNHVLINRCADGDGRYIA